MIKLPVGEWKVEVLNNKRKEPQLAFVYNTGIEFGYEGEYKLCYYSPRDSEGFTYLNGDAAYEPLQREVTSEEYQNAIIALFTKGLRSL